MRTAAVPKPASPRARDQQARQGPGRLGSVAVAASAQPAGTGGPTTPSPAATARRSAGGRLPVTTTSSPSPCTATAGRRRWRSPAGRCRGRRGGRPARCRRTVARPPTRRWPGPSPRPGRRSTTARPPRGRPAAVTCPPGRAGSPAGSVAGPGAGAPSPGQAGTRRGRLVHRARWAGEGAVVDRLVHPDRGDGHVHDHLPRGVRPAAAAQAARPGSSPARTVRPAGPGGRRRATLHRVGGVDGPQPGGRQPVEEGRHLGRGDRDADRGAAGDGALAEPGGPAARAKLSTGTTRSNGTGRGVGERLRPVTARTQRGSGSGQRTRPAERGAGPSDPCHQRSPSTTTSRSSPTLRASASGPGRRAGRPGAGRVDSVTRKRASRL